VWQSQEPPAEQQATASSSYAGRGAPLTTGELQSLLSPIALSPDALVAQILSAATFPDQIAVANYWLQQNKNLTGSALMQAVDGQSWDPSVKALTQFPSVLNNMAQNLSWTLQLGEAYHNQQSEVMSAVQTLRAQAKSAGNLKSTPQQTKRHKAREADKSSSSSRPTRKWSMFRNTILRWLTERHIPRLDTRPAIVPQPSLSGVDIGQPLSPMKALALLSNLRSADVVLPTTDGREIRLRRITEPDAEQASLLHQLRLRLGGFQTVQ